MQNFKVTYFYFLSLHHAEIIHN